MKPFYKYCTLVSLSLTCANAHADFVSSSTKENTLSVKEALKKHDNENVILEGFILSQIRKDKYLFSDGTDKICVKIEKKENGKRIMPAEKFDEKQKIRIKGEVDKDNDYFKDKDICSEFKIEVYDVQLLGKK